MAQVAPAVRVALGEEFGFEIGTNVERKTYQALRMLGFDDITDTNFAADVTILEEGNELLERIKKAKNNEEVALHSLLLVHQVGFAMLKPIIQSFTKPFVVNHLNKCKD